MSVNISEINRSSKTEKLEPALYIVPTPIGNLEDITLRAIRVLNTVDIIACEDTRRTGQLLKHFKIPHKKLMSYHEHNESNKSDQIVNYICNNKSVALVSDAGTPGISDPGYRVVKKVIDKNIKIISLPGASAFVPVVVASGLPVDRFVFVGFPPHKKGRKRFLSQLIEYDSPIILYESPHRLLKLMNEVLEIFGKDAEICIGREISKVYEEYIRGSIENVLRIINEKKSIKGEFVIIIHNFK